MRKTAASAPIQQVVAELLHVAAPTDAAGRAEAVTMLRAGGGVRIKRGRIWLEAVLPSAAVARRLASMMVDLYDCAPPTTSNTPNGSVHLRQWRGADLLARRSGLLDARGRPVQGMPAALVAAAGARPEIAAAATRGTVLASGRITGQRGSIALHARCDSLAAAMAVAGFTRRLGAEAALREHRGGREAPCSVVVHDFNGLHPLLLAIGAPTSADELVDLAAVTSQAHCAGRLEMANRSRAVTAARGISDRLTQAVATLGAELPGELSNTMTLRLAHPEASMAELGRLSDPPVSKNVIAGRLRRLLIAAERRHTSTGVPA
jgi:hypothetical protein